MSNLKTLNQSTPSIPILNIASYSKKINAILHSEYARLFLNLIQYNQTHRKKIKMLRQIAPKKSKVNWRIIYLNLLRKVDQNYQLPKMTYKYLDYRALKELRFLYKESKLYNLLYFTYVDIYLSKMMKLRHKIEAKTNIEKDPLRQPTINKLHNDIIDNNVGGRKKKSTKSIRILAEDNSEDESQKEKKKCIIDHMNQIKNESRLQSDKIINAEGHQKKTTYKNVKSKYKLNPYDHQPLISRAFINDQSLQYSSCVVNSIPSNNNYNAHTCLTEPNKQKKRIRNIKPYSMNLKKNPEEAQALYYYTTETNESKNTKQIKKSLLFPMIEKSTSRGKKSKKNGKKQYGSIQIFQKRDFYYM